MSRLTKSVGALSFGLCLVLLLGCAQQTTAPVPPVAAVRPTTLETNGQQRVDEYYWLQERDNPEVRAYLEAENSYADQIMAPTQELQEQLFQEITGRIKQDDSSVPSLDNGYWYSERYEGGQEYPVYYRRADRPDAAEELLLDVNQLAAGAPFCTVRGLAVSPDHRYLAYAIDQVGRRKYTIRFKDLSDGTELADAIPEVTSSLAWANDGQTLLYCKQHPQTLRWYRIYRHQIGTPASDDVLVYEEKDETFSVAVERSRSGRYLVIECGQTLSTEVLLLDADNPQGPLTVVQPRQPDLEYHVFPLGDQLYLHTNYQAKGFRLMRAPVASPGIKSWQEVVPHRDGVLLEAVLLFTDYLVTVDRQHGLQTIRIRPWSGGEPFAVKLDEPAYSVELDANPEQGSSRLRYRYTSLTTPESVFEIDLASGERQLLKQEAVLGGFSPDDYTTERLLVTVRDQVQVPVSLVYRRGLERDGSNPLVLYGYGSYGYSSEVSFRVERLSLLDRGWIWAIAHIRGGQEMGREWYEDGKLLKKKNTFYDFIDCAHYLIDEGYTASDRIVARGGSAGGLLVGAVITMEPALWAAAVAHVPFVDVVTTMLDTSIPLTTSEFDEWGDPREQVSYDYMLSYSPYDNVAATAYPSLLVTTGLHDSQVQYWEPAKWVARLRARKTGDSLLLLRTDMSSGHGGASGRFYQYREIAFEYAFLLLALDRCPVC